MSEILNQRINLEKWIDKNELLVLALLQITYNFAQIYSTPRGSGPLLSKCYIMWRRYLEDLVGTAHGGDFVVGVGSSQFTEVTHWSFADLTVHVHLLHLMLWTHEHLMYLTEQWIKINSSLNLQWSKTEVKPEDGLDIESF